MEKPVWADKKLLEAYELPVDSAMRPLTGGLQHEVWKVTTPVGQIVLKKQLVEPSAMALALEDVAASEDIACAKRIRTIGGQQVFTAPDSFIRAYEYLEGTPRDREPISEDLALSMGGILATLHVASQKHLQRELAGVISRPIVDYYQIDELGAETHAALAKFTTGFDISGRQAVIGHRDISGKNTIVTADGKPYLIDFDEAGLTTIDGEVIDAAFNLAGVHTPAGPQESVVRAFVRGYREHWPQDLRFDETSFHVLFGMSEYWWLGVCLNRIRDGRVSENGLEEQEKARLLAQIPRDLDQIDTWLTWLND